MTHKQRCALYEAYEQEMDRLDGMLERGECSVGEWAEMAREADRGLGYEQTTD